jgi:hypothetical protein
VVAKSAKSRLAKRPPLMRAMTAIIPSGAVMRRPCRSATLMMSPQASAASVKAKMRSANRMTPRGQALLQARGPLVGANLPDTEGNLGNCHRRQCQLCIVPHEPGEHSGVWRLTAASPR